MNNFLSEDDDYIDEEDDYYTGVPNDYLGEIVQGASLEQSLLNKDEQEISFVVRSLDNQARFGKAQLVTETGDTYDITIIGIGHLQPHPDAVGPDRLKRTDQIVIIRSTDLPIELAQQARIVTQQRRPVEEEE